MARKIITKKNANTEIIDSIKDYLGRKKHTGEQAVKLEKKIAEGLDKSVRYVHDHLNYMAGRPLGNLHRVIKKVIDRHVWYYLPGYEPNGLSGGTHQDDVKKKLLKPLINGLEQVKITWNGVFFSQLHKRHHTCKNEDIVSHDLSPLNGNHPLLFYLLRSGKKEYGDLVVETLYKDFIKNHVKEEFGNPKFLLNDFEKKIIELWKINNDLFTQTKNLVEKKRIGEYVEILIDQEDENVKEYVFTRIILMCRAYTHKMLCKERGELDHIPYDKGFSQTITRIEGGFKITDFKYEPYEQFINFGKLLYIKDIWFLLDGGIPEKNVEKFISTNFMPDCHTVINSLIADEEYRKKVYQVQDLSLDLINKRKDIIDVLTNYFVANLQGQCQYTG